MLPRFFCLLCVWGGVGGDIPCRCDADSRLLVVCFICRGSRFLLCSIVVLRSAWAIGVVLGLAIAVVVSVLFHGARISIRLLRFTCERFL